MKSKNPIGIKYLTPSLLEKYKDFVSPYGDTLESINKEGFTHKDSHIGLNIGDAKSYEYFEDYFEAVLSELHPKINNFEGDNFDNTLLLGKTNSYRVRLARNIQGFPLPSAMNRQQRVDLLKLVKKSIDDLNIEFLYKSYESDENSFQDLPSWYFFTKGDSFYDTSGLNNDWPLGRAVFYFKELSCVIWVGEEDHLRIFCHQDEGDFLQTYKNAIFLAESLEKKLGFYHSNNLAYLTTCPTNLGTGMRISIHYKLPESTSIEEVKKMASNYDLSIRGTHGERSDTLGGIIDISNSYRHGRDPLALFTLTWQSICELIKKIES
ncbi:MAG: hypothetical protein COB02_08690 [Candidatus Cloacimonadota bacterium]|nr:MAG: hypothetical protein COB02_08690 [Candidatus Cloacimonadota bacterium]